MDITIEIGELLWNADGTVIMGVDGIAAKAIEQTIVTFSTQEAYDHATAYRLEAEEKGWNK